MTEQRVQRRNQVMNMLREFHQFDYIWVLLP